MSRIYVVNLKKYNNNENNYGEWLDLPCYEDLDEFIKKMSNNNQNDIAIHDHEFSFDIEETQDIKELDNFVQLIEDNSIEEEAINHYVSEHGITYTLQMIEKGELNYRIIEAKNLDSLGIELFQDSGQQIPENIINYFNGESYLEELENNGTVIERLDSNYKTGLSRYLIINPS